jgi:hypothetical protein
MKQIFIKATVFEAEVTRLLIERLANLRIDAGNSLEKAGPDWLCIDTSTIEAFVNGGIHFSNRDDLTSMPYTSCFLFTCMKRNGGQYDLTWVSSLS